MLVDSEYLASRVESELARELGLTLSVDEAHELFLGKTVDGVLDAIAARTGTRPVDRLGLQLGVRHRARLPARTAAGGRRARCAVENCARRGHPHGGGLAVAARARALSLQVAGLAGQFGEHIYVTSMVRAAQAGA